MYTTTTIWATANLDISAAGSVAASVLNIPGNSGALSGIDISGCSDINDGATGGTNALSISDSVDLQLGPGGDDADRVLDSDSGYALVDSARDANGERMTREQFALNILGGVSPEAVAATAGIRWGQDLPASGGGTIDGHTILGNQILPSASNARASGLNWGCPNTQAKLEGRQTGITCTNPADTAYYPVIAVRSPGTNNFKIQGHGQGLLIILGDADLRDLNFFGVVIVTGDVQLNGTGYIGGAFIALGDATLGDQYQQGDPDQVAWNGRTFVRFNRCGLNAAQAALAGGMESSAPQQFDSRSLSWFEVVR